MNLKFIISLVLFAFSVLSNAEILISEARVKAPVPGQSISAGYMNVVNKGDTDVVLEAVSTVSAERVEMHTHTMENGMMGMVKMDSVVVKAGETVTFVEGGHHLMLFGPSAEAIENESIELEFTFDNGVTVTQGAVVEHLVEKKKHMHHH